MFQSWRRRIREATVAFRNGQLDEAGSMLKKDNLCEFKPGRQLAVKVADEFALRARRQAALGHSTIVWRDLQFAAALQEDNEQARATRAALLERGLREVERYLAAGDARQALDRLRRLGERHGSTVDLRLLRRVAEHLLAAAQASRQGCFAAALEQSTAAATLRPDLDWFPQLLAACTLKAAQYRAAEAALETALAERDATTALARADALLALAPESPLGLAARRRECDALRKASFQQGRRSASREAPRQRFAMSRPENVDPRPAETRMILWIDAVGGFLVCLGDEIVLGRPAEGSGVDVPILADLSRRHAVVRREGESYLLEAMRATKVDGRPVSGVTTLADGGVIELAGAVEIRFRRPHPLSASARLEIISGHKTTPHVDAVLLMAENCVLGPAWHNHVVCRPWQRDVVLFRQRNQLCCRSQGGLSVAGEPQQEPLALWPGMRVEGEDLAFSIEAAADGEGE